MKELRKVEDYVGELQMHNKTEVAKFLDISMSTLDRRIKSGEAPKSVLIGGSPRMRRFFNEDVVQWKADNP